MPDAAVATAAPKPQARLRPWRRLTQIAGLGLLGQWSFYGVFRCPFVVPYVSCSNCPVITCHGRLLSLFWGFWLLLPLSVVVFGRAYCGWACPGGLANQLLGKLARWRLRPGGFLDKAAPYGKYLGLALALYVYFLLGQPRADVPIRVGPFFASVALTFEHAGTLWLMRGAVILGFLLLGLALAGAWCRFACPAGGALDLLKGLALFKVYKTSACTGCDACRRTCEAATRPEEANCTNCGDCLDSCPAGAIGLGRKRGS